MRYPDQQQDHHCKVVFAGAEGRIVLSRFPFILVQTGGGGIVNHRYWLDLSAIDWAAYSEKAVALDFHNTREAQRRSA